MFVIEDGVVVRKLTGVSGDYTIKDEYLEFNPKDVITIFKADGSYREYTVSDLGIVRFESDDAYVLKQITYPQGKVGRIT